MAKSELDQLITEIKKSTSQIAVNKVDEVRVMKSMLNDKNFSLGVYDRNIGYIGQKCPHDDAVKFVKGVIAGSTGLDNKDAQLLAENYQFTNKDANFLLSNMRDFIQVYTDTGRKINIMQCADSEASLFIRNVESTKKQVPDKDNPGKTKEVTTSPYTKLVSISKCPKYALNNGEE